uniref:Probable transaldolase n=1 Tax=uncultured Alphaproteobacteria bacterium TaxID=91750 RepID=H5SK25_9PROT|nr:transaldolase [uncultured Alphaproteobacteria bacterium]
MKLFADSADVSEIAELAEWGLLDGVTTNPTLVAKTGRPMFEVLREICRLVQGPVSAEVTATDTAGMVAEGRRLAEVAPNIVVKLPLTPAGLAACRRLVAEGIRTNLTLCFSPAQGLLAAKAGATFVSPFVGRLDDIGHDGMAVVRDIVAIYRNYPELKTQVLAASLRHVRHVVQAAIAGADAATAPPAVLRQLVRHPLTDIGLERFLEDWRKSGQKIG